MSSINSSSMSRSYSSYKADEEYTENVNELIFVKKEIEAPFSDGKNIQVNSEFCQSAVDSMLSIEEDQESNRLLGKYDRKESIILVDLGSKYKQENKKENFRIRAGDEQYDVEVGSERSNTNQQVIKEDLHISNMEDNKSTKQMNKMIDDLVTKSLATIKSQAKHSLPISSTFAANESNSISSTCAGNIFSYDSFGSNSEESTFLKPESKIKHLVSGTGRRWWWYNEKIFIDTPTNEVRSCKSSKIPDIIQDGVSQCTSDELCEEGSSIPKDIHIIKQQACKAKFEPSPPKKGSTSTNGEEHKPEIFDMKMKQIIPKVKNKWLYNKNGRGGILLREVNTKQNIKESEISRHHLLLQQLSNNVGKEYFSHFFENSHLVKLSASKNAESNNEMEKDFLLCHPNSLNQTADVKKNCHENCYQIKDGIKASCDTYTNLGQFNFSLNSLGTRIEDSYMNAIGRVPLIYEIEYCLVHLLTFYSKNDTISEEKKFIK